jgi:hypothetical protein
MWNCSTNTNTDIARQLNITPSLREIQDYKRKWIQHLNRVPRNRLPRQINCTPKGKRNQGKPLKMRLDVCVTGTGQQVIQLLESYMIMMMM